jgi:hypothetical protein
MCPPTPAERLNSWRADDDVRTRLAATYRSCLSLGAPSRRRTGAAQCALRSPTYKFCLPCSTGAARHPVYVQGVHVQVSPDLNVQAQLGSWMCGRTCCTTRVKPQELDVPVQLGARRTLVLSPALLGLVQAEDDVQVQFKMPSGSPAYCVLHADVYRLRPAV